MKYSSKTKDQLVDEAWEGFKKVHDPDVLTKIGQIANDREEAMIAAWRLGFYYALLSMEKGIIGMHDESESDPSNN